MRKKRSDKISFGSQKGFTLIEIMVAMAISGMVMGAIYMSFRSQIHNSTAQGQITEMQQNIRAALHVMVSEIRMAGYDTSYDGSGGAGITTATRNNLVFTLVADNDGLDNDNADGDNNLLTGADETGELQEITYRLYDPDGDFDSDIGRQDSGVVVPAPQLEELLAENIEDIYFYYTLEDGTSTPAPANPMNIRSIEIAILARSAYPGKKISNINKTYLTPDPLVTFGPYTDNFRRRLLTTRVQCRNIGL